MKKIFLFSLLSFFIQSSFAQMLIGKDTLFGNEWIDYNQKYYKLKIANDGIYRLNAQELTAAGVPLTLVKGNQFRIYAMGKELPLFVSNKNIFQATDFIEFYGRKNRGAIDAYLYQKPDLEQMNPAHNMFNDTISYFLTWSATINNNQIVEIPNNLTSLPAKESYYLHQIDTTFTSFDLNNGGFDKLSYLISDVHSTYNSSYDLCEGFASTYSNKRILEFKLNGLVKNTVAAKLDLRLGFNRLYPKKVGTTYVNNPEKHNFSINWNSKPLLSDSFLSLYSLKTYSLLIDNNELSANNSLNIEHKILSFDKHRIATLQLTYPKNFDFENKKSYTFNIDASSGVKYIEIQNFNATANNIILYDLTNNLRLVPSVENGLVKIVLPSSSKIRTLVLINNSEVRKIPISPIVFVDFQKNTGNYVIISNKNLYVDTKISNTNWVQEYANYRSSSDGGNFKSIVVEIQQIYDQFGYGVDFHPISMRNFTNYTAKEWKSKFIFIIGKALEYREARDPNYLKNFGSFLTVPTFGYPGSDNLITATAWSIKQSVPIGRIPVVTPNDIRIYLKKIKEFEKIQKDAPSTIDGKLWMKNVVHLVGGEDLFDIGLKNMGNSLVNSKFGAKITTFYKTSTDPVQSSNSEILRNLIRKGVSIMNFYGHSSPNNIGYSIDAPNDLGNKGRYFYFMALGCYTGQMHIPSKTLGSTFIFEEDAGAIAFCAPSHFGLTGMLDTYASNYYSQIGGKNYGKSNGEAIQSTINSLSNSTYLFPVLNNMSYHGDPAIKMNPSTTQDYVLDLASAKFEPEIVTTLTNRFKLKIKAYNIGRADRDTITCSVIREMPNGSKLNLKRDTLKGFIYDKELVFNIDGLGDFAAGLNKFYLKIDADNKITELPSPAEANNDLNNGKGIELFIYSNDVSLLEPVNYSIQNKTNITLKATPTNAFVKFQKYIFEIDTTAHFNSTIKIKKEISQSGGVISWMPSFNYKDSTVYYWRVSPDSLKSSNYNWKTSSFIYLKNSSNGWNQSHYFQYTNNEMTFMELPEKERRFQYQGNSSGLIISNNYFENLRPFITVGSSKSTFYKYHMLQGEDAGVICWVVNDTTGLLWVNVLNNGMGLYNSDLNGDLWNPPASRFVFPYRTSSLKTRTDLVNFLEKTVPSKSYVIFMTVQALGKDYMPKKWAEDSITLGKNIFSVLEKQGAKMIRQTMTGARPYFYFYRKDDPTFAGIEKIQDLDKPDQNIGYNAELKGFWYKGQVKSVNIGTASKWSAIHWKQSEVEAKDTAFLNVYGVKKDGKEVPIFSKLLKNNVDISALDPKIYPNLRLEWYTRDSTKRTSPQLDYWRVLYDGVPEAVPNAAKLFKFQGDSLQQGQPMELSLAAENVSQYNMKDLLIKYNLKKSDNSTVFFYQKYKPLISNDTVVARFRLDTRDLEGKNTLTVQINPDNNQVEQDTTNNSAFLNFVVEKDKRNPLVDVTFDGTRILNGDIVSPEPSIVIQMKDENKFLLLDDTSVFKIYLRKPEDQKAVQIPFNGTNLKFIPATSTKNNRATVEFNPEFDKDGDYELLVRAKDISGNKVTSYELKDRDSGYPDFYNYKVGFKVITKSSISKILNYPNPFTTSTHFVYTLTGKEPPAYFKIQVMSISGRVVRELTQDDLGALRTGTHQTDKAWDGTDQFGDRLANGVYLYKIIAKKSNGEDYESHETGADQFFKNDVGKLVILR